MRQLAWLAWHTAALSRVKRMPAFERFCPRPPRHMSPEEMARRRAEHEELVQCLKH